MHCHRKRLINAVFPSQSNKQFKQLRQLVNKLTSRSADTTIDAGSNVVRRVCSSILKSRRAGRLTLDDGVDNRIQHFADDLGGRLVSLVLSHTIRSDCVLFVFVFLLPHKIAIKNGVLRENPFESVFWSHHLAFHSRKSDIYHLRERCSGCGLVN